MLPLGPLPSPAPPAPPPIRALATGSCRLVAAAATVRGAKATPLRRRRRHDGSRHTRRVPNSRCDVRGRPHLIVVPTREPPMQGTRTAGRKNATGTVADSDGAPYLPASQPPPPRRPPHPQGHPPPPLPEAGVFMAPRGRATVARGPTTANRSALALAWRSPSHYPRQDTGGGRAESLSKTHAVMSRGRRNGGGGKNVWLVA